MSASRLFATGAVVGTGANLEVAGDLCPFRPASVKIFNLTSGDELHWHAGMADAAGFKRVAAGTGAAITTGGVTPGDVVGFTLGTDADINASGETLAFEAWG